jgi:prepilin-type N-terminal cleavage/methylation domain-containing protein
MIKCTIKDRKGVTLIELLVVVLIVSILAAIAQPRLQGIIVKARAADAISDMQLVRLAVYNYQTDQQAWPSDAASGIVPPGLDGYLPENFDLVNDDYTLDFENWGGSPFLVGVSLITSDSILGRTALEMLASPKWTVGNKYTWVIE